MSDSKMVTERDAVLNARAAYRMGVNDGLNCVKATHWTRSDLEQRSALLFPLPKVTRPRVVTDVNGRQFRIESGQMQTRLASECGGAWLCMEGGDGHVTNLGLGLHMNAGRVRLLADLLANPTEEVVS